MQTNSHELTTDGRFVTIEAKPEPVTIDTTRSATLVVDMQNDFAAKGGCLTVLGSTSRSIEALLSQLQERSHLCARRESVSST